MKLGKKLSFGVQAVQAGQKSSTVNAAPQLIANSTEGKFSVTSAISKALNVAVGENIMFLNNLDGLEQAIQARVEDIVNWATEVGVDLDTIEGYNAAVKEFGQWFIAKGVPMYKSNGEPIMANERCTKEDKLRYIAENAEEILAANREALVEKFGDLSDEELIAQITPDMVPSPQYHACSGSKTATSSSSTGVGCQLNFTDTSIWNSIKTDIAEEERTSINRVFSVNLEDATTAMFNNGKENVEVTILPIEFVEDAKPIARVKKEA